MKKAALRGLVVGSLALLTALVPATAHAAPSTGFGPFGPEILTNPVPGPVVPAPNVYPLPPPVPAEPGFAPAPGLPERLTFPVPEPGPVVQDGPGSGHVDVRPGRVDADKPPTDDDKPGAAGSADDHGPDGGVSLDPSTIRFSQSSVNDVAETEASMRANGWVGRPIDVVRMPDGGLTAIDNTRLLAAARVGIDVRATVRGFNDPIRGIRAEELKGRKGILPTTWGEAVTYRIGRQNFAYRSAHPMGSPTTSWSGN